MTSLRGNLGSVDLANIFQMLSLNQREGTLHIFDGHSRKAIYFGRDGVSMLTRGKAKPDSLGRILIRFGRITAEQLKDALRAQHESEGRLLGQVLVEQGLVTREDVEEALRTQIEEEVYSLFIWKDAQFEFVEGPPGEEIQSGDGVARLTFSVNSLIMEAARRVDEWEWIQQVVPSTEDVFRYTGRNLDLEDEIFQRPWSGRVLEAVDGRRSVDEIIDVSCVNRFEVVKILALLVEGGAAERLPVPELRREAEQALAASDTAQAVKFLSRLVALKADTPEMHRQLAESFEAQRQIERAAFHYRVFAEILADAGDRAKAFDVCRRICDLLPTDLAAADRAIELFTANPEGVEQHAADVVARGKLLAEVYCELGRKTQAIHVLQRVVALGPDDPELRGRLIQVYLLAGMTNEAIGEYEALAEAALAARDLDQAERIFRKILQIDRTREDVQSRLNQVLSRRRMRERGLRIAIGAVILLALGGYGGWRAWSWWDAERQLAAAETSSFGLRLGELRSANAPLVQELDRTIQRMSGAYRDPAAMAAELKDNAGRRRELLDRANAASKSYSALAGEFLRVPDVSPANDAACDLERRTVQLRQQEEKIEAALVQAIDEVCDRLEPFPSQLPLADQERMLSDALALGEAAPRWLGGERGAHVQAYFRNVAQTMSAFRAMQKSAAECAARGDTGAEQAAVAEFLAKYLPPRDLLEQIELPRVVSTRPAGARILVDGRDTGAVTPAVVRIALARKAKVRLVRDGFQEASFDVAAVEQVDPKRVADQLGLAEERILVKELAFRTPALPTRIGASPVVAGDRMIVPTRGAEAVAFDLTGVQRATFATRSSGGVQVRPLVFDDVVVFASLDGLLHPYRLAAPQESLPREALPGKLLAEPAQWGRFGIFADADGHVTAYEVRGRTLVHRWMYPRSGPGRPRGFAGAPVVSGDVVALLCGDGSICVLDAATGAERRVLPVREGGAPVTLAGGIAAIDGFWVGVARGEAKQSRVLLIDRETHEVRSSWTVDGTVRWTPVVSPGAVHVITDEGDVTTLRVSGSAFQGARTLSLGPGVRVSAEPLVADGVLYAGDSFGTLWALDVRGAQPERLYDFRIPGTDRKSVAVTTRPAVHGQWVLFGAADNAVYGLLR